MPSPIGIGVDPVNNALYWVDSNEARISKSDLNGANSGQLLQLAGDGIHEIFLDLENDKMYFSEVIPGPRSIIRRADLDGTNIEEIVDGGFFSDWRSIFVDTADEIVYFDDLAAGQRRILRYQIQTDEVETLVGPGIGPLGGPVLIDTANIVPEPSSFLVWAIFGVIGIMSVYLKSSSQPIYSPVSHDSLVQ